MMTVGKSLRLTAACIALAAGLATAAPAPALAGSDDIREWTVAGDQEIGGMRGGYVTEGGLQFSFGVEKSILVDGILKASHSLNVVQDGSGVPRLAPGQSPDGLVKVVQIGPGNSFDPGTLGPGFFTVVQNSMDDKVITNLTKVQATLSVLGLCREIGQADALNRRMIQSLR
jgi:hypothetical protein